jgi:hypothetical protein
MAHTPHDAAASLTAVRRIIRHADMRSLGTQQPPWHRQECAPRIKV